MAKQRKKSSRRFFARRRHWSRPRATIPIALLAGIAPTISAGISGWQRGYASLGLPGGLRYAANDMTAYLTGWNMVTGSFDGDALRRGMVPLVLGVVAHKLIGGMFGVNRMLSRVGIPLLRI